MYKERKSPWVKERKSPWVKERKFARGSTYCTEEAEREKKIREEEEIKEKLKEQEEDAYMISVYASMNF